MKKLLFIIMMLCGLVACGGDDSSANADDQTLTKEQIEEKFNLPPEPDPELNNATIEGIDSNNNDIRDDWERAIVFEHYKDPTMINLHNLFAVNIARSNKAYADNDVKGYVDAQVAIKEIIDCSYHLYGLEFKNSMFYFSKNTTMRDNYMLDADSKMSKHFDKNFYFGHSYEYLNTECLKYKK